MVTLLSETEQNLVFLPSKPFKSIDNAVNKYCKKGITTDFILNKLQCVLTNKRYLHSLSVAQKAEQLAKEQGLNPQKALLAGLLHDYAKLIPDKKLLKYAKKHNIRISTEQQRTPEKLHAPVGASKVRKKFGITDNEILRAIATHGIGSEDPKNRPLEALEKLIIIADKIEPFKKDSLRKQCIESVYAKTGDLSIAAATVFKHIIKSEIKKSGKPSKDSLENYNALIREYDAKKDMKRVFKIS